MGAVIPFTPGASLARIEATASGFRIALRSRRVTVDYDRRTAGDTAELAVLLRDEGEWTLRFGEGTDEVRAVVEEIDEMNGEAE